MRGDRRGFTLIEVLIVSLVLIILSGIALLKYLDLRATAQTAALAGDVRAVTVAAFNYYAEHEAWPPESGPGQVPDGLGPFLPGGLAGSFDRSIYLLDYDNIPIDGSALIGVSVTTTDPRLQSKLIVTFGNKTPFFVSGTRLTYLIAGPGGVF